MVTKVGKVDIRIRGPFWSEDLGDYAQVMKDVYVVDGEGNSHWQSFVLTQEGDWREYVGARKFLPDEILRIGTKE